MQACFITRNKSYKTVMKKKTFQNLSSAHISDIFKILLNVYLLE